MKTPSNILVTAFMLAGISILTLGSCGKDKDPVANDLILQFDNTFKGKPIILGGAGSSSATVHTSAEGQPHQFSEVKYVISHIRLIQADGTEFPYHINDLDKGATVVDQSKTQSLSFVLNAIPAGDYREIRFGLGVKPELNTLDQVRFPAFYAQAGANDTEMMWEWGMGYRFVKIEGFYDTDHKELSIHTGSTVEGTAGDPDSYTQGVDAYREINLALPQVASVGKHAPRIRVEADFDQLLSGSDRIILSTGSGMGNNATPNVHTALQMLRFVDNMAQMFSIQEVINP